MLENSDVLDWSSDVLDWSSDVLDWSSDVRELVLNPMDQETKQDTCRTLGVKTQQGPVDGTGSREEACAINVVLIFAWISDVLFDLEVVEEPLHLHSPCRHLFHDILPSPASATSAHGHSQNSYSPES